MNKVFLIGNLVEDPKKDVTTSGVSRCMFRMAVQRRFANQQTGQREADFVPVVAWRQTADLCAKYLAKGRKTAVVGSLQTRSYDAQDGSRRYVTEVLADEVEFLGSPKQSAEGSQNAPPPDDYAEIPS